MKKIVIAGANSFVASHFVHELLVQGFDVIALVRGSSDQVGTRSNEPGFDRYNAELSIQF